MIGVVYVAVVVISKAGLPPVSSNADGSVPAKLGSMGATVVVPAVVPSGNVRATAVVTFEAIGVLGGAKARNSAPPFPAASPSSEAKRATPPDTGTMPWTVPVPPSVNSTISPVVAPGTSATKRLLLASKANPRGLLVSPVAKVVFVPYWSNSRIAPSGVPLTMSEVDTKRLPELSKARPMGPLIRAEDGGACDENGFSRSKLVDSLVGISTRGEKIASAVKS